MAEQRPRGRAPDWDFRMLDKDTEERGKIGVGWDNDDGSIRVKLNTSVVLTARPGLVLTLFAYRPYQEAPQRTADAPEQSDVDDLPF